MRERKLTEAEKQRGNDLANVIMDKLNTMAHDSIIQATIEALGNSHRTLQQTFTQLCFEWLRHLARQEKRGCFDLRNQASCEWAAKVVQVIGPDGALPFV